MKRNNLIFYFKNKKNIEKSFTLIELLLIISIITIIFPLNLIFLQDVREKGKDEAIVSSLSILRQAGEQYIGINKDYNGFCGHNHVAESFAEITKRGKTAQCYVKPVTFDEWAICSPIYNNTYENWCVDNEGSSRPMPGVCDSSFNLTECP